jgi:4-hydroxy-tetrahydrodipicolinate reductase
MKLILCGAGGRMGRAILGLARKDPGITLAGLVERPGSPWVGKTDDGVAVTARIEDVVSRGDAVIDFTSVESTLRHAPVVAAAGKALVVGTTGLAGADLEKFTATVKNIPVVLSPNMSLSANVFFDAAERMARLLPGYDAEIVEIHHNQKKDAPSGTARRLAESVRRGKGQGDFVYGRQGVEAGRKAGDIGVHAVRGGDVVGDHTVLFLGPGERVELVHRVTSRDAFATGALVAATWAVGKPAGLYDMRDVLGLK